MFWVKKIQKKAEWVFMDFLFKTGMGANLLRADFGGARILVYHGIDLYGRKDLNTRFISHREFEQQLRYFKAHFHLCSLEDYFSQNYPSDRFTLSITFDDGYRNNLKYALPLLEKYEVPTTFFITAIRHAGYDILWADYLDVVSYFTKRPVEIDGVLYKKRKREYFHPDGRRLKVVCKERDTAFKKRMMAAFKKEDSWFQKAEMRDYWELLSEEEIRTLAASPFAEIGTHGYFHDNLGVIPFEDACTAIRRSKNYLEGVIDKPIRTLAYPDGSYSREVVDYARQQGLDRQLAVDFLFPEDIQDENLKERLGINPFISLENQIHAILKGGY